MLRLVMIVFNDMPLIQKCIESVIDHVDQIVAIDGIFKDFPREPGERGYSTDGTLEYLSSLDKEVSLAICPDLEEVEKRNLYLIGEPGDWYLMLDTDEWVENPGVLEDLPDYDALFCPMIREGGVTSSYARLFRHVEGLHYEGLHYRLVDGQGRLTVTLRQVGEDYTAKKYPLVIHHDREKRPKDRIRAKHQYYKKLTEKERHVKEMLRYG